MSPLVEVADGVRVRPDSVAALIERPSSAGDRGAWTEIHLAGVEYAVRVVRGTVAEVDALLWPPSLPDPTRTGA